MIGLLIRGSSHRDGVEIQVKGKRDLKANLGSSFTFSADVSNRLYLLNGPSPLYALYIAKTKELSYVRFGMK